MFSIAGKRHHRDDSLSLEGRHTEFVDSEKFLLDPRDESQKRLHDGSPTYFTTNEQQYVRPLQSHRSKEEVRKGGTGESRFNVTDSMYRIWGFPSILALAYSMFPCCCCCCWCWDRLLLSISIANSMFAAVEKWLSCPGADCIIFWGRISEPSA